MQHWFLSNSILFLMARVCFLGMFYVPETPSQFDTRLMLPILAAVCSFVCFISLIFLFNTFFFSPHYLIQFSFYLVDEVSFPLDILLFSWTRYWEWPYLNICVSQVSVVFQLLIILMLKIALLQSLSFCSFACQSFNIFLIFFVVNHTCSCKKLVHELLKYIVVPVVCQSLGF